MFIKKIVTMVQRKRVNDTKEMRSSVQPEIKILVSGKNSVDVFYKGKRARFFGELGIDDFKADAGSMRWMEPVRDALVLEEEREEWMYAIRNHSENLKVRICFVESKENDIKKAEYYWRNKEYTRAGELFEKHVGGLTKSQIKKLEYIKKHSTGDEK